MKRKPFDVDVIICFPDGKWRKETLRVKAYYRRLAFTLGEDEAIEEHGLDKTAWAFAVDARLVSYASATGV